MYTFAGGEVKIANKKFTAIKNDYCLTLGRETEIQEVEDDDHIVEAAFSFTGLKDIENIVQSCTIDVIGIILDIQPVSQIGLKDGTTKDKRSLTIGDESNTSIGLTLWGDLCEKYPFSEGQIVAF